MTSCFSTGCIGRSGVAWSNFGYIVYNEFPKEFLCTNESELVQIPMKLASRGEVQNERKPSGQAANKVDEDEEV